MESTATNFRWAAKARTSIAFCLTGALVGAGLYLGNRTLFPGPCHGSGSTYLRLSGPTGDCVGYTDGGYVFDPSLAAVEHDIQQENQRVTAQHPSNYVSVVLLLPISADVGTIMSMTTVLNHLRGAYTAQYRANHNDVNGQQPYIRLLIGNVGNQANHWSEATSIITGAATSQRIVAATGLGVSLNTTLDAVKTLTGVGIPVVGSSNSADEFSNIRNMIRVTPSNEDEISAANAYAKALFLRAILVEDDNSGDTYDSDLGTDFGGFRDNSHRIVARFSYDTSYRDTPQSVQAEQLGDAVVQDRISKLPDGICTKQGTGPAVVLFAGRGRDLAELVSDLADRPCLDMPIYIVTGDDAVNMPPSSAVDNGLASGVTVDYPAVADQNEWAQGTGPKTLFSIGKQGFTTFKGAFQGLFPGVPLTDENLMVSYDATLTAISAIRLVDQPQPTPDAVAAELSALNETHTVYGASGPLSFTAHWPNPDGSNPVGKPIPLLRYTPNGPQFLKLYWPPYN